MRQAAFNVAANLDVVSERCAEGLAILTPAS